MQAMILAAGLGTRLKPITQWLPKPLFPILNTPILKIQIKNLKDYGFKRIIINLYHLSSLIENELKKWDFNDIEIITLNEKILLGTGGGIRNALNYIDKSKPLVVINSDVVCSVNIMEILKIHAFHGYLASLLTHFHEKHHSLKVENNLVKEFGYKRGDALSYTGICILNSDFIKLIPENTYFCLIDAFREFLRMNGKIYSIEAQLIDRDYIWEDIGTPETYLNTHKILLKQKGLSILKPDNTSLPDDLRIEGWVCMGNNIKLGKNIKISNSVIWDNSVISDNSNIKNTIFYDEKNF